MAEASESKVCCVCIGEEYLSDRVKREGSPDTCTYCAQHGKCVSLEWIADAVESAIQRHFYRTSTQPDWWETHLLKEGIDWDRKGEPIDEVIAEIALVDEPIAKAIREILSEWHYSQELAQMGDENEFDEDSYYEINDVDDWHIQQEWHDFERSLKTSSRYFNPISDEVLKSIFGNINAATNQEGRPVITSAGPETDLPVLYRARVTDSFEQLSLILSSPDRQLAPPTGRLSRAGRMNAQGISVFYGATTLKTAFAEVRPPVGSSTVVGCFHILRRLRLLDVEMLRSVFIDGSYFDPTYFRRLEHAKFLGTLSQLISRPVIPSDEPIDYVTTQVIAEYLAHRVEPRIDGILYPSAQIESGKNVVLFNQASRVEQLAYSETESVHVDRDPDSGDVMDYVVWEKRESPENATSQPVQVLDDMRPPTLRLQMKDIKIVHAERISYEVSEYSVRRYQGTSAEDSPF